MKMKNRELKKLTALCICLSILLSVILLFINKWCAFICLAFSLLISFVFIYYTKKRYDEIECLNDYLTMVCSGNYNLSIDTNKEGELSILKNNLYKIMILLRSQNESLIHDKAYLADSIADISHQLKTPLTSIMMMTDLIKNTECSEKTIEFADIIENQTDKMKWLIITLLKLSKLDAGTADLKNEEINITEIISESLKPFMITLDLKGISLKTDLTDFCFNGDKNWSIEAFANIIKNCIEHTSQNGILKISSKSTTLYNEIVIEDNGCGIAEKDLPHIFERFYHGKNADADSVGIGLALAKSILEQQHGNISVKSEESKGTSFTIRFYKSIV